MATPIYKELYNRMPADRKYVYGQIETNDKVEQILTRIKMILGTYPGQVLGAPSFGIDIHRYLFAMDFDQKAVEKILNAHIADYVAPFFQGYDISCTVNYGQDHYNHSDYAVIDIIINGQKTLGIMVNS